MDIPRKTKSDLQPLSKPDAPGTNPSNGTHKVDDQPSVSKLKRSLEDDETGPSESKKRRLEDSKSMEVLVLDDGGENGAIVID